MKEAPPTFVRGALLFDFLQCEVFWYIRIYNILSNNSARIVIWILRNQFVGSRRKIGAIAAIQFSICPGEIFICIAIVILNNDVAKAFLDTADRSLWQTFKS